MKIKMQQEQRTLESAFGDFIQHCRFKNLSPETIIYYQGCYTLLTKFIPESTDIKSVNYINIEQFVLWYKEASNVCSITINSNLRGIRAFLYYCMKLDYLIRFKIELIKAEKKIKETYSDSELNILLKKPNIRKCSFAEYRDWAVINYALATGNRISTIINLRIKDVDLHNNCISLHKTKNKKQQIIPISITLVDVITEYLTYRKGQPEDFLFCNSSGGKLCQRSLQDSIAKYNQSRGVIKRSMHLFRHTFAKKWILAGGDIFRLQKILGHSSLDIVKEYVNMFNDDLKKDFEQFNPLDQMTSNKSYIKMK